MFVLFRTQCAASNTVLGPTTVAEQLPTQILAGYSWLGVILPRIRFGCIPKHWVKIENRPMAMSFMCVSSLCEVKYLF